MNSMKKLMSSNQELVRRGVLGFLAILGLLMGLGSWAFSSPVGASPDDDFHLASSWCGLGDRDGLCEAAKKPGAKRIDSALNVAPCFAFLPKVSAECQSKADIFTTSNFIESTRGSFSSDYPPVFYAINGTLALPDIQTSVVLMRMLNIIVFVGSLITIWLLISAEKRKVIFWMWAATLVPLGMFLIASNNPSSWAITGVGTAWLALYGYFESQGKRSLLLGALFGVEVIIASGSRGDAAIYTILGSVAVIALNFSSSKQYLLKLLLPLGAAIVSLGFYFSSQQSAVASTGLADSNLDISERTSFGVFAINAVQLPELWVGAFGNWGLGWLDTKMPGLVWVTSAGIFVLLITLASRHLSRRKLLVAGGIIAVLYFLPLYVLQKGLNHVGEVVQPRYILPLIIMLAGVIFLSMAENKLSFMPLHVWMAVSGLFIANSLALYVNTKRYVSGLDNGSGFSLDANIEWWWAIPISPMSMWTVGTIGFGVALFCGYQLTITKVTSLTLNSR